MCMEEGATLQRGMNFMLKPTHSVVLMSVREDAPYQDHIDEDGRLLIYEGHDVARGADIDDPKNYDQPLRYGGGNLTQNGLFYESAMRHKLDGARAEFVRVYEKLRAGVWVYNGVFELVDAWQIHDGSRMVCKFKLKMADDQQAHTKSVSGPIEHTRFIPSTVKQAVWRRDQGKCVICGSSINLHFDHIIPFSRGGTSLLAENIQLLCATCNLKKRDKIE